MVTAKIKKGARMLEVRGIRNRGDGYLAGKYKFKDITDLFNNYKKVLFDLPESERCNLYYTVYHVTKSGNRGFEKQDIIPFDIDNIDLTRMNEYVDIFFDELKLPRDKVGVLYTGNGLQFLVYTTTSYSQADIENLRLHYNHLCTTIDSRLEAGGLILNKGEKLETKMDTSVWATRQLMRFPGCLNVKEGRESKQGTVLQSNVEPVEFDFVALSGMPLIDKKGALTNNHYKRLRKPPIAPLLEKESGCAYIRHVGEEPGLIHEPDAYAYLSIVGRCEGGDKIAGELYPFGSDSLKRVPFEKKLNQALEASGPRTCEYIETALGFEGCKSCPHYGEITSPILIRSKFFIPTEDTGFWKINIKGKPIEPQPKDLTAYMSRELDFKTAKNREVFIFDGKKYVEVRDTELEAYANRYFKPEAKSSHRVEFIKEVQCTNLVDRDWFQESTEGLMNFSNGVLNLRTGAFSEHSAEYGFRYCLEYKYDPDATSPVFDSMLKRVTCGDESLEQVLLEFMGYSLSQDKPYAQKALVLLGEGSNGKSVFLNVLGELAGEENYATLTISDLKNPNNRSMLESKFFNLSEETPTNALTESTTFKNIVTGGGMTAKKLYKDSYNFKNTAKIIFACNEMPQVKDLSHGLFRRLIIVPFNAVFDSSDPNYDPFISEKMTKELPGIFNRVWGAYQKFHRAKKFSDSQAVDKEIQQYKKDNDTVAQFIEDKVDTGLGDIFIKSVTLFDQYKIFCEELSYYPEGSRKFIQRFGKITGAERMRVGSNRGFKGVAIRS